MPGNFAQANGEPRHQARTSVLRSKTLAQAEFISAEHFDLSGIPKRHRPFWEVTQKQLDELHIAVTAHEE